MNRDKITSYQRALLRLRAFELLRGFERPGEQEEIAGKFVRLNKPLPYLELRKIAFELADLAADDPSASTIEEDAEAAE
jgi:hypothetical protein